LCTAYGDKVAFSTSLGVEDQVITQMLSTFDNSTRIFTLDTGRLFQESYELLEITCKKYGLPIRVYFPDTAEVESMVSEGGPNLFYESIEKRKFCCHVRKVKPLHRALGGIKVWITGLRKDQSVTRVNMDVVEWDEDYGLLKVNPLMGWSNDDVWKYVALHHIPVSELHAKGYPSIGCQPCTRPVKPGEDLRSGRWWWELPQNRECGLHTNKT
jgi:phosphoadenosine phosphosulfate reductase